MDYIVDAQATAAYADSYNQPCGCIYCQNYQKTFADAYPEVVQLLREFGVPIHRPLEVMDLFWNPARDKRRYISYYSVKGELFTDKLCLYEKDAAVTLYQPNIDAPIYKNTGMEMPYFILEISDIQLPWVLPEAPED